MSTQRTILVIADFDRSDKEYEHQLQQDENLAYKVVTARYDTQSSILSRTHQIDGILLELDSPHSDSSQVLRQLKEQMGDRPLPIVVIDGDDAEMAVKAFKHGATDYLVRNRMTSDDLRLAMRSAIENSELRRELQYSQDQFRTSVENMLDCFGIFSSIRDERGQIIDFRIDYLNAAACQNHKIPKEMQMGCRLCEWLPVHRESGLFDEYCHVVETGEPLIKDSLIYDDLYGGQKLTRAYDIRVSKLNDGFVASWRDITDRKHLELELNQTVADLRQQKHQLQRLIDTVPIGIAIATDASCAHMQNNAYLRQLLGVQPGNNISKSAPTNEQPPYRVFQKGQEIPTDNLPMQVAARLAIEVRDAEFDIMLPDGTIRQLLSYATPLLDEQNQVRGSIGAFVDITERNQALADLQTSQRRYRELAEAMPQMVWTADALGTVNYWNQRWYEYTGLSEAESMGFAGVNTVHPEERDRTLDRWGQSIANGELFEIEYRIRRWDGVYHWFMSRAIPTRDPHHQVTGWIGTLTDIDDLKRSEALIQQQLAEIEAIYQSAPVGLNVLDTDFRFVRINQQLAQINGLSVEAHIGHTVRELFPALADTVENHLRPILETGEPLLNVEIQGETPAQPGVKRIWREHFLPLKHNDRVIGISTVCEEITEHIQVEEALRQSEERFRSIADNISQFAWMADEKGGIFWYNQRWFDYTGTTLEEMQGWGWQRVHHPDHVGRVLEKIQRCFETGEIWEDTFPLRGRDGQYRWFLSRAIPVRDAQGNVLQWFGTNTDITDRQQAENALRQSEERYRCLAELIPQLVWTANSEGVLLDVNQRWTAFTGLTLEQVRRLGWEWVIHPEDIPLLTKHWTEAVQLNTVYQAEGRMRKADGTYRWYLHQAIPQRDERGQIVKWFGTATDIEAQKQLEIERVRLFQLERTAREAAEQANRIKDEFLAVLSHELRSPLNPILGWSKLLQSRKLNETRTAEALATIERNAKVQTQLIDDLLDVAKILRGKLSLSMTSVNLSSVVEAAIETVRTTAVAKSISLHTQLSNVGQVSGDPARLQQIVWNLLSNAIKFTPCGGQVRIQMQRVGDRAEILVSDTGKGISLDFLPYIFESFRQEDASITRQYGGLGLGLAIVQQLVEVHGGAIAAESPGEGFGATFTVQLPLLNAEPEILSLGELPEEELDLTGIRVLTVDDEPDARELLTVLLNQYGAEVLTVTSAAEVLANLESFRPDVLVSDIAMPEVDGYALIQQIRSLPSERGGSIPAIALTAYARESDRQQSLTSGYQRHVTKPLEPEQLVQAVMALAPKTSPVIPIL